MAELATRRPRWVLENDSKAFKGIFVASFIVYLLIALVASTMALRWRSWLPGAEGEESLIGGVKAAVYTFMSYLT
jgi:light-harvesting complex 1 beta chain